MVNKKELMRESTKEGLVDTAGNVISSLVMGSMMDYVSGLRGWGIVASRTYATGINLPTSAPYGKWRNLMFKLTKTTDKSNKIRQSLVELLAYNSFQVPLYSSVILAGTLIPDGKVDWDKVQQGTAYLATISLVAAPAMGLYGDRLRKVFKLKSAPEKAKDQSSLQ